MLRKAGGCLGFFPHLEKLLLKNWFLYPNSEFMKLEILPKKRPISAAQAIISIIDKKTFLI